MRYSAGACALAAVELALRREYLADRHDFDAAPEPAPHFRSGIERFDQWHPCPGFYGTATVAAPSKIGKTMIAVSTALETAATRDWRVVLFNGEIDENTMSERVRAYLAAHPGTEDALGMLQIYHVGRGVSPEELVVCIHQNPGPEQLLVVIDSLNTLASLCDKPYLVALRDFSLWAMMARRISGGAASFLLIAETNKSGGIKGENLQFWSDLVLRMQGTQEQGFVDLEVTHSRRTACGRLGRFVRHIASGSFIHQDDIDGFRVVQGGRS